MQEWDENSGQVIKMASDKEKAKGLLKVVALREKSMRAMNPSEMSTLIVEAYYEIIKELITALMAVDGWKTLSHEMLVGYLARFYKEFSQADLYVIDQLRKTRNDIAYRGVMIKAEYLIRNKQAITGIMEKLKKAVRERA